MLKNFNVITQNGSIHPANISDILTNSFAVHFPAQLPGQM